MKHGFKSDLVVRLLDDLAHNGRGLWELHEPLEYHARDGRRFTVPAGTQTDFASVPRLPVSYAVFGDCAHRPAVLHDYLLAQGLTIRHEADAYFFEAMLATGMPAWKASIMHQAVRAYSESLAGD